MNGDKDKYSIWLVPPGDIGRSLSDLISGLANEYDTPAFVPHMTLVANIFANETELNNVIDSVNNLAKICRQTQVVLEGYDTKDDEFRSLYIQARSTGLDDLYEAAEKIFPQAKDEHFRAAPHLSVMYSHLNRNKKTQIINSHPIDKLTFTIDSLDLYRTNESVESWELVTQINIPG